MTPRITLAALAATLAAALAAPATAQVAAGPLGAIAHFNAAKDRSDAVVATGGSGTVLSTRSGLSAAQAHFNADADSQDDRRLAGATIASGTPDTGAAIFARIAAESAENE